MDDKCACCGEWTTAAYDRYDGLYNDGTEMELCECTDEDFAEMGAYVGTAWDLGVSLPAGHPFAPVVDGLAAA